MRFLEAGDFLAKEYINFVPSSNSTRWGFDRLRLFCYDEVSPSSKCYSRKARPLNREGPAGNGSASLTGKEKTMRETKFFLIKFRHQAHE